MPGAAPETAAGRYEQLSPLREGYLMRAREAAELTIPALFPPEGHNGSSKLYKPYQSVGARGVNNISSKLLITQLPPNTPFFKYEIDDFTLDELAQEEGARANVEEALGSVERSINTEIETSTLRPTVFESKKQLVVAGNVLLYVPRKGRPRAFRLDKYVVKRSPSGEVLEIILKECVAPAVLPAELRKLAAVEEASKSPDPTVDIYTWIKRDGDTVREHQEVAGHKVPESDSQYPVDESPWLALRWTKIDGEDYGRSYVEEYIGDLQSLEGLAQLLLEGSAAAARTIFFVNPNGTTNIDDVANAKNGDVVPGDADDVKVMQAEKRADFSVVREAMQDIERRLGFAFLLNSTIQRNGERVTAEEIRYMAGELEDALGGIYSLLSQEFQLPLVRVLAARLREQKKLPKLPDSVQPKVVTGIEALGRGHDLTKLEKLFEGVTKYFGPETIKEEFNVGDAIKRLGTSLGIDMKGLQKSEDQKAEDADSNMQNAMVQNMGPDAIKAMGGIAQASIRAGSQPAAAPTPEA